MPRDGVFFHIDLDESNDDICMELDVGLGIIEIENIPIRKATTMVSIRERVTMREEDVGQFDETGTGLASTWSLTGVDDVPYIVLFMMMAEIEKRQESPQ